MVAGTFPMGLPYYRFGHGPRALVIFHLQFENKLRRCGGCWPRTQTILASNVPESPVPSTVVMGLKVSGLGDALTRRSQRLRHHAAPLTHTVLTQHRARGRVACD